MKVKSSMLAFLQSKQISTQHLFNKNIVIATFAMTLTACVGIPPATNTNQVLAQPQIPITQPYTIYDSMTSSSANQGSIAGKRWQSFYKDEKLKQLIAIALQNNADIKTATLAVEQTRTKYQISERAMIPRLGGNAGYTRSATNAVDKNPSGQYQVGLGMSSYELDFWGKIRSLKEQSLQEYFASTAAKDAAQISLISSVAQVYVQLSYAIAQLQLTEATVDSREQSLTIAQARFDAGVDSKSPSLQAFASLEGAKQSLYATQSNVLKLKNAMQLLLGAPIPAELMPTTAVSNITNETVFSAGLPSQLLHYRPDILQAEYNLKAAGANINVARAAYFPSISLTGNLGVASGDLDSLFKNSAVSWSFGPSISVPVFDAGQTKANYHSALLQQQQMLTAYEKSIQQAFKEVSDVLADRATVEQQLKSQYQLQDNFKETYQIAYARYRAGLDNYLGVLDVERSKFFNQQDILKLEQQKIITQINLYQALGGGANLDMPVTLAVPNIEQPVTFIDKHDALVTIDKDDENRDIEINTNQARLNSTAQIASEEEVIELIEQQNGTVIEGDVND